jgi:hypothetical protein
MKPDRLGHETSVTRINGGLSGVSATLTRDVARSRARGEELVRIWRDGAVCRGMHQREKNDVRAREDEARAVLATPTASGSCVIFRQSLSIGISVRSSSDSHTLLVTRLTMPKSSVAVLGERALDPHRDLVVVPVQPLRSPIAGARR